MPGGDGTGPMGAGPMTGRAAGYCASAAAPGYARPGFGGGFGFGRRGGFRGRGYGWASPAAFYGTFDMPTQTPQQELDGLKQQAQQLQSSLEQLNSRIEELQK